MLLTEEESREKWCPHVRTHATESERRKYPRNGRGYCGLAGRPE